MDDKKQLIEEEKDSVPLYEEEKEGIWTTFFYKKFPS
jgi:hypothetical protein